MPSCLRASAVRGDDDCRTVADRLAAVVAALVGGGSRIIRPGAIARAATGILFLDEAGGYRVSDFVIGIVESDAFYSLEAPVGLVSGNQMRSTPRLASGCSSAVGGRSPVKRIDTRSNPSSLAQARM